MHDSSVTGARGDREGTPDSQGATPVVALRLIALAAALSGVAATAQLARYLYVREVKGGFAWASRDVLWMAPVAFLAIFVTLGGVLALSERLAPRLRTIGLPTVVLAFAAAYSVLSNVPRIHVAAMLLLSLGIAVQFGRWLGGASTRRRRVFVALGLSLVGLWLVAGGIERVARNRRTAQGLAHARGEGGPNVLFLLLDTVRAASMSLHGYSRPTTPVLDSLARESIVFDRAFAPSSWTLPSHASFFTGRTADKTGVDWKTPFDGRFPLVASRFASAGYATGAFTANAFYVTHESGLAEGFSHLDDYDVSVKQLLFSANLLQIPLVHRLGGSRSLGDVVRAFRRPDIRVPSEPPFDRRPAQELADGFLRWSARAEGKPWFAFLNWFDAHTPLEPPAEFRARFAPNGDERGLYDAGIAYMDRELGVLLDSLRARGELEGTILVITSDHGEQYGEHGLKDHGNSLYLPLVHVPLLVRLPGGAEGGQRISTPVSLVDLPATLLEAAKLPREDYPGEPLVPWDSARASARPSPYMHVGQLDGRSDQKDPVPARRGSLASLVDGQWHYIRVSDGSEELYDIATDPQELRNLVAAPTARPVLDQMRRRLRGSIALDSVPHRSSQRLGTDGR